MTLQKISDEVTRLKENIKMSGGGYEPDIIKVKIIGEFIEMLKDIKMLKDDLDILYKIDENIKLIKERWISD